MKAYIHFIAYVLYVLFGIVFFKFIPLEHSLFMPALVVFGAGGGLILGFAFSCFEKEK